MRAADNYPVILADEKKFVGIFRDTYSDPVVELQQWRERYAKQFEEDIEMEEYLKNVQVTIAFEKILRVNDLENLVEKVKFLETLSTLEQIVILFPWTAPSKLLRVEASEAPHTSTDTPPGDVCV